MATNLFSRDLFRRIRKEKITGGLDTLRRPLARQPFRGAWRAAERMFIVSSIERSSLKESKRAACSAEENRGTRAQPRRTRACARRNRKRSCEQAKQSRCYFCAWKAGAPSGERREEERNRGEEGCGGSGRWWQCLSYLVWIAWLTSSPATKKIFNSWTTDDGGPKKG